MYFTWCLEGGVVQSEFFPDRRKTQAGDERDLLIHRAWNRLM